MKLSSFHCRLMFDHRWAEIYAFASKFLPFCGSRWHDKEFLRFVWILCWLNVCQLCKHELKDVAGRFILRRRCATVGKIHFSLGPDRPLSRCPLHPGNRIAASSFTSDLVSLSSTPFDFPGGCSAEEHDESGSPWSFCSSRFALLRVWHPVSCPHPQWKSRSFPDGSMQLALAQESLGLLFHFYICPLLLKRNLCDFERCFLLLFHTSQAHRSTDRCWKDSERNTLSSQLWAGHSQAHWTSTKLWFNSCSSIIEYSLHVTLP